MAKKILEFDYYEDQHEFDMANNGAKFAHVLWDTFEDMQRWLRRKAKCPLKGYDDERRRLPEEIQNMINENPEGFKGLAGIDPEVLDAFFRASMDFTMEGVQKLILEKMEEEGVNFDMIQ